MRLQINVCIVSLLVLTLMIMGCSTGSERELAEDLSEKIIKLMNQGQDETPKLGEDVTYSDPDYQLKIRLETGILQAFLPNIEGMVECHGYESPVGTLTGTLNYAIEFVRPAGASFLDRSVPWDYSLHYLKGTLVKKNGDKIEIAEIFRSERNKSKQPGKAPYDPNISLLKAIITIGEKEPYIIE